MPLWIGEPLPQIQNVQPVLSHIFARAEEEFFGQHHCQLACPVQSRGKAFLMIQKKKRRWYGARSNRFTPSDIIPPAGTPSRDFALDGTPPSGKSALRMKRFDSRVFALGYVQQT